MIVLLTTATTFKFISRNDQNGVSVTITNDATNVVVYSESITLTDDLYYKVVTDLNGFNIVDNQRYILEIKANNLIVYRDILVCDDNIDDNTFIQNTTDDANEFIIFDV